MPTPRTVRILLAIGLCSLSLAGVAAVQLSRAEAGPFHGTAYPDSPAAPPFTLVDHTGRTASLSDQEGRAVLLFFGFTRCPDVCPLTLARIRRVLEAAELGPEQVGVLFVSVDPEYDTPDRLAAYVESFGPAVTGLTGDSATVAKVLADYGVYAQAAVGHDGRETLAHTSILFGIDRAGRLRVLIHPDEPAEIVGRDIRSLVRITG